MAAFPSLCGLFGFHFPFFGKRTSGVPSKVLPNLYLAACDVEADLDSLKRHNITHVLQAAVEVRRHHCLRLKYHRAPLQDVRSQDLVQHLQACFDFIEEGRRQGAVLVHCVAGISRSASIVIAYLMWKERRTYRDAYVRVRGARPVVAPNKGFKLQLWLFEKSGWSTREWQGWDAQRLDETNELYLRDPDTSDPLREMQEELARKVQVEGGQHELGLQSADECIQQVALEDEAQVDGVVLAEDAQKLQ